VEVRIVSATHCDLEERVRAGRFRADLFYRLGVLRLSLPSLRERTDDLVPLAEWCLKHALAAMGVRPHANLHAELVACAPLLQRYDWPGNVRELRNLMQRIALVLSVEPLQALTPSLLIKLAPELSRGNSGQIQITSDETDADIENILQRFDGNRALAAAHLGISRTTLWRRLKSGA
jgi:propionate catabolism operon transcriptional regulator